MQTYLWFCVCLFATDAVAERPRRLTEGFLDTDPEIQPAQPGSPSPSIVGKMLASLPSPLKVVRVGCLVWLVSILVAALMVAKTPDHPEPEHEDSYEACPVPISEDLYGLVLSSMIRNLTQLSHGTHRKNIRAFHMLICNALLVANQGLQLYLAFFVQWQIVEVSENKIRQVYDKYEIHMYGKNEAGMEITKNGYRRGTPGNFNAENFKDLPDELKVAVCQVPFSQPVFLFAILLVWTLTIFAEFRRALEFHVQLVVNTPTTASISEMVEYREHRALTGSGDNPAMPDTVKEDDSVKATELAQDEGKLRTRIGQMMMMMMKAPEIKVVGLTIPVKVYVVMFITLPRFILTGLMMELGSEWLSSTNDWAGMIGNVVALAFIIDLNSLMYDTIAPNHAKIETQVTMVKPVFLRSSTACLPYAGAFLYLVLAVLWILAYLFHLQPVLPDYRWDVGAVCANYLESLTKNPEGAFQPGPSNEPRKIDAHLFR